MHLKALNGFGAPLSRPKLQQRIIRWTVFPGLSELHDNMLYL